MPQPPRAVFAMNPVHLPELFPPRLMARLQSLVRSIPLWSCGTSRIREWPGLRRRRRC